MLNRLRARDAEWGMAAKHAVSWLVEENGDLADVCQMRLCEFLWYTLSYKFLAPVEDHIELARATGHLFTEAGMTGHADLCQSPTTIQVLRAWQTGSDEGFAAYERALAATGLVPPPLADFQWSDMMGIEELEAHYAVSRRLEEAIAAGMTRPGRPDWKKQQRKIASDALTEARSDGRSLLEIVEAERIRHWARLGGEAHRELAGRVVGRLPRPITPPEDAAATVEPLRWLLERAQEGGLPLTERHNLARSVVADAVARFPKWRSPWGTARNETDVFELHESRYWLQSLRALRRRGRRLLITETGRKLLGDTEGLWRAAVNEFGYVAQICEVTQNTKPGARGFILPPSTQIGNPADPTPLPNCRTSR